MTGSGKMNLKGICRKWKERKIFSTLNIVSINVDAEMISTILVLLNTKVLFDPKSQITMNIMRYFRLLEIPLSGRGGKFEFECRLRRSRGLSLSIT